jgi:hypothetical protein
MSGTWRLVPLTSLTVRGVEEVCTWPKPVVFGGHFFTKITPQDQARAALGEKE